MSSQWGSQKVLQGFLSHKLAVYLSVFDLIFTISRKFSILWNLALWMFKVFVQILFNVNLSLNQTVLTFLLCVRQTWMTHWFWQFVRGYLPLIQKDSVIHMHGLVVYLKEGLPFAQDLFLENSTDSFLCFWLALLYSVSYFCFPCGSPSLFLCIVVNAISPSIDEVFLINPSANIFVIGDLGIHHKDWLIFSGGIDRPAEFCLNFSISNFYPLLRWLSFLLSYLTVNLTVLLFWISSFLLKLVLVLQWLPLHGNIWLCVCLRFHWFSIKLKTGCPISLHWLWLFLCWLKWSSSSFTRCSMEGYF